MRIFKFHSIVQRFWDFKGRNHFHILNIVIFWKENKRCRKLSFCFWPIGPLTSEKKRCLIYLDYARNKAKKIKYLCCQLNFTISIFSVCFCKCFFILERFFAGSVSEIVCFSTAKKLNIFLYFSFNLS